ncbi:MAG: type II secretion system protein GspG [Nitrospirota bacterium]
MKRLIYILPLAIISITACSPKKTDTPPPPKAGIIENYAAGLGSSMDRARGAKTKVDMDAVQKAVQNFQLDNGRYPDSLDAIKGYIQPDVNLGSYAYDPASGTVSLRQQ